MRKISFLLLILLSFTLSGCNDSAPVDMELSMTEYDLPYETEYLLLNNGIMDIYDIDGLFYIVIEKNDSYSLVALDKDLSISFELDDFGYINRVSVNEEELLEVYHYDGESHIDIFNLDGEEIISMKISKKFNVETNEYRFESPNYLKSYIVLDDFYFFVKKVEDNRYQLIKSNGVDESILYEYNARYVDDINVLSNQTFILSYRNESNDLNTLVHIDEDGNIIHQEEINLMRVKLLSDGYLLELFGPSTTYYHIRRDVNSNDIWEFTSQYLTLKEEHEDHLLFKAHSNNSFDLVRIYNDGTFTTSTVENENKINEYLRDYLNDDTFLYIDRVASQGLYTLELYSKEEELIKKVEYTYSIKEYIKDDMFYIIGYDGTKTIIDLYDFEGNLIRTDKAIGEFVSFTNDGNYITKSDDGMVNMVNTSGRVQWQVDSDFVDFTYFEVNENISMIRSKNFFPVSAFIMFDYGPTLIIDNRGRVVTDLSEYEKLNFLFKGDNSFYLFAENEKILFQFDSFGNISQEISMLCDTFGTFYSISEGKLITYQPNNI